LTTPAVCWKTPWTPQKQPPAITAVWTPLAGATSIAGAGITTASSAARDGMAKANESAAVAASRDRTAGRRMAILFPKV
jgi:hypothetical protein